MRSGSNPSLTRRAVLSARTFEARFAKCACLDYAVDGAAIHNGREFQRYGKRLSHFDFPRGRVSINQTIQHLISPKLTGLRPCKSVSVFRQRKRTLLVTHRSVYDDLPVARERHSQLLSVCS